MRKHVLANVMMAMLHKKEAVEKGKGRSR